MAYALVLGRQHKTQQAQEIFGKSKSLLSPRHPDYAHLLSLQHFVAGMIYIDGALYGKAIAPLRQAVDIQQHLDYPEERSVMLNALGYAHFMNQGKGATPHDDLPPHYHVHRRDMERSLAHFRAAYKADVQNSSAASNYRLLIDTLQLPLDSIAEDRVKNKNVPQLKTWDYASLPANMQPLLSFINYDEVVFLLDISGSMVMEEVSCVGRWRFDVMRETALLLLENFSDSTLVGIGTIGGDCGTTPRLWHPVGELSRTDMRYALEFLVPDGTTPLLTILQETPSLFSDNPTTTKALVFISDGENICRLPGVDICNWAEQLTQQHITINTMTFLGASLDNTNAFAEYTCLVENTFGSLMYLDGNRCRLEHYRFDLVKSCQLTLPPIIKMSCWGSASDNLWGIFPE
ncbi:MAG: VWA domain-containing protein [Saprospiraceae bacterium]